MDVCFSSHSKPEMEEKNCNHHPSLPSNYVTIAQLQERWLKQRQQNQQTPQQQEEPHRNQKYQNDNQGQQQGAQNRGEEAHVVRTRGAAFRSSSGKQIHRNMQPIYIPKIHTHSGTKSATDDKHRESKLEAGNRDENADLKSKGSESKKKKHWNNAKRKPRVEERGTSEGASDEAKSEAKNEKEEKSPETVEAAIEGEVKKEEEKFEDVETAIEEGESNEKKRVDSKLEVVEDKIRGLSVNSVNGKQNEGLRRVRDDFRYTQFQRSFYGGRSHYSYRNGYGDRNFGGRFRNHRNEVKSLRAEKMVWVRKDNHVGGIERET